VRVHVTLKGTLAERLPGGRGEVDLADGARVQQLADALDLPNEPCVFVVNGTTAKRNAPLSEGDRVQAFPPMAGG
jgi:molybdopterin converting factor small subunit